MMPRAPIRRAVQADFLATKNLSYRLLYTHHVASESFKAGGGKGSDYIGMWQEIRF